MKSSSQIWLAATVLGFAACAGDPVLPSPDNIAELAFESPVSYACGAWHPARPDVWFGLFDVYWISREADRPSAELLAAVEAVGGVIVYGFHINQVRAILDVGEVPGLGAGRVDGVVDPNQVLVRVFVRFAGAPDPSVVTELGGTVTHTYTHIPVVAATIADDRLPALRGHPLVTLVESYIAGCLLDG